MATGQGNMKRLMIACVMMCGTIVCGACEQQSPSVQRVQAPANAQPAPKPEPRGTPAEKPTEKSAPDMAKPDDKSTDIKPSTTGDWPPPANPPLPTMSMKIGGRTFQLEQALDDESRFKGLSGRTSIPEDGGMIFIFPQGRCKRMEFVMRDCPIDIDIIYVDSTARITAMHHMKAEPPRAAHERELSPPPGYPDAPRWTWTNEAYESRLRKWSSRYTCCVAIELRAGTLKLEGDSGGIELKVGDKLDLDIKALQAKAK